MRKEQKIVAAGAASGVATMALGVWILTAALPVPLVDDALAERLTYALSANVFALLPFFIMLVTVGNARFRSDAIDPTRRAESRSLEIDGRVADNTLQQNFVFAVVSLALSTIVAPHHLQVIWACAIVFVIARCVFWVGYRMHPLYRAPGMAATAYLNLGMILFVVYWIFKGR
jgi:uncharacterized membrane protein YecN with MAPEG domain